MFPSFRIHSYFRDSLHMVYRSSAKAKQARKRAETEVQPTPTFALPTSVSAAIGSFAPAPSAQAAPAPFPSVPMQRTHGVDIIDMNLLDCIAPVENEDFNSFNTGFNAAAFWEVAHAV
jgi:hypothetical protein